MSARLPGRQQTNQRAELLAVVVACLRDPRPLDIRSDSDYVCKDFASWKSWALAGWSGDHPDLWNLLAAEMLARTSAVHVVWVKGHATNIDISRGRTTEEDKRGNDEADELAVSGAELHQVSPEVLDAAKLRKNWARQVQRMMVMVLQARFAAEEENRIDAGIGDRGSDCDCMESFDDELDDGESSDCESCLGDCVAASADAAALPDTEDEASDTEDLHGHVYMNSLDDDFERREGIQSDV
jgi:ribonuclease HI